MLFTYEARDPKGQRVSGTQDANDEEQAIKLLQGRGYMVTNIKDMGAKQETGVPAKKRHQRVKGQDLMLFTSELATMLNSGVSLVRSLEIVSTQITSQRLFDALIKVQLDIKSGASFQEALSRHPKVFPPIWEFIIEAGEISGKLPFVLEELAHHLQVSEGLKGKIISALTYPCVVICVATIAIAVFLLKIIPIFADLFEQFNADLPALTQGVIDASDFLGAHIIHILIGFAIAGYAIKRYIATPAGRRQRDLLLINLPLFGNFFRDSIIARLAVNLSVLFKSGVDFIKSLDIAAKATGNVIYQEALKETMRDVEQGTVLSEAMLKNPLFSSMMTQMLTVGEEIGKLDDMLVKVGEYYEARVDVFISRLGTLIEPLVLVTVGAIVGVMVVAMFLPMFNLSTAIR
jgi:type IV pilus assembly protein PilC